MVESLDYSGLPQRLDPDILNQKISMAAYACLLLSLYK